MAAISSISGMGSATQAGWQQLRLQQARQNADRAEAEARALQEKAATAQQVANQADENAREISTQADQAGMNAGRARQGLAAIRSAGQMQAQIVQKADQIIEAQKPAEAAASTAQSGSGVVNAQGQVTGTVVNTTA